METVEVSIITVNYNGLKDTCALIDTIPFSEKMEVIVVDNASRIDEAAKIKELYPYVRTIRSNENLGFAGGNNLGMSIAKGRYFFLINNDTVLLGTDEEKLLALHALTERLNQHSNIGMVCPKIRFTWENHPIQFAGYTPLSTITLRNRSIGYGEEDCGQYDEAHVTPYAHGAAMMVKREAVEKAGMMPDCYFLYYEELDWSVIMTRANYQIWYDSCFTVYHKESQTTGQASPLKAYYITRNRLLFALRNIRMPQRILTYVYLMLVVSVRDFLKYLFSGRMDMVKSTFRGICDFMRHHYNKM